MRALASVVWLLGWGGSAPAGLQTRLISGECQGSECSSAVSPPTVPCLSEPKICPQESPPIPALPSPARSCLSALSNGELGLLTSSGLNQHKRGGKFIPFYMQAQRHLEPGVAAKSRCVHYLLAVRQYHVSENATKLAYCGGFALSNIFLLFILVLRKKR